MMICCHSDVLGHGIPVILVHNMMRVLEDCNTYFNLADQAILCGTLDISCVLVYEIYIESES